MNNNIILQLYLFLRGNCLLLFHSHFESAGLILNVILSQNILIHNDLPKIPPDPLACQVNVHFNTDPQRGLLELAPDLKLCVIHRYISPANTVNRTPHRYAI